MPIIEPMLAEMEWESRATTKVLERVPSDRFDWRPHEKSMSLGALAWHVAGIPKRVEDLLRAGKFDVSQARPGAPQTTTTASSRRTRPTSPMRASTWPRSTTPH